LSTACFRYVFVEMMARWPMWIAGLLMLIALPSVSTQILANRQSKWCRKTYRNAVGVPRPRGPIPLTLKIKNVQVVLCPVFIHGCILSFYIYNK